MQQPSSARTEVHVHHALDPGDILHLVCRLLSTLTYSVPAIGHVRGRALDAVYRTVLQARSCTTARLNWCECMHLQCAGQRATSSWTCSA